MEGRKPRGTITVNCALISNRTTAGLRLRRAAGCVSAVAVGVADPATLDAAAYQLLVAPLSARCGGLDVARAQERHRLTVRAAARLDEEDAVGARDVVGVAGVVRRMAAFPWDDAWVIAHGRAAAARYWWL